MSNNLYSLEDLKIYVMQRNLISYTNMILKKFPKSEIYAIANIIEQTTYDNMKIIIEASKNKTQRGTLLNRLDTNIKFLLVLVRVSYKNKYIDGV